VETLLKIIYIFLIIFSLLRVLFITLLERKYLGIINNRKGPNHYFINSLFQSLIDFIKLLFKKNIKLNFTLRFLWNIIIFYGLLIFLLLMLNFPLMNRINFFYLNFFFFFFFYEGCLFLHKSYLWLWVPKLP
jgi:NADH-quinone oxidoreductase subunit H